MQLVHKELKERGLKLYWLAERMGETSQSLTNWKTRGVPPGKIKSLAEALGVSREWLESNGEMSNIEYVALSKGQVPLISWVQAGSWEETIDNFMPGDAEEWLPAVGGSDSVFCLRIIGDSMTSPHGDSFPEGFNIWVDPEQRTPENGEFVVARHNGNGAATFKQYKLNEAGAPYLKPLNHAHPTLFDEFEVIGTMIFYGRCARKKPKF